MTRFANGPCQRDQAAATVVGALLVLSLAVVGLITYRTGFVPVWEEEAEKRVMGQVAEALLRVRSDLDEHVGPSDRGRLSTPVPTSSGRAMPSAPPREGNILSFQDRARSTTVHADDATVWRRNGTLQLRENMDWQDVTGVGVTIGGIDEVLDLRVRFPSLSSADDGDSFVTRIIGATGGLQGLVRYSIQDTRAGGGGGGGAPERSELVAQVEDSAGDVVFDQTIATFTQAQTDYEVDLLDPSLGFDQILASAPTPIRLVFVENGLEGQRAITFRARNTTSDATVVEPGGGPVQTVHETFPGGVLEYDARNNFYVDQTYRIEAGALVLEQPDGAVVRAGPSSPSGRVEGILGQDRVGLGLALPSLEGADRTIAGAGTVTAATEAVAHREVRALAPEVSVNFTTDTPEAWASWARDHYRSVGLAPGEFTVASGAGFVNVTVQGPSTDPAIDDVHLDVSQARITTTLER